MKIGKNIIGLDQPVFIIAEAGVNHNGNIELAKKLVEEAKKCGADCVKFQTFKSERVVIQGAPKASYQLKTTDPNESQIEMLKKLELPMDSYKSLMQHCSNNDITFLSTPYNEEDVDFLDDLGVPAFKLASICAAEPQFVNYVAKKGKPVILSTGMATLEEVRQVVSAFTETGNKDLILLQCTANYPSRIEDTNLRAMVTMRETLGTVIGYSDHTQDDTTCIASVALGATVIEKHFTLDKNLPGPDQSSSYGPAEFMRLVRNVRKVEVALGSTTKQPCEIERKNAIGMRRSLVAKVDIEQNTVITTDMVTLKRPATGIKPSEMDKIIGKKVCQDILADSLIHWSDLEKY